MLNRCITSIRDKSCDKQKVRIKALSMSLDVKFATQNEERFCTSVYEDFAASNCRGELIVNTALYRHCADVKVFFTRFK